MAKEVYVVAPGKGFSCRKGPVTQGVTVTAEHIGSDAVFKRLKDEKVLVTEKAYSEAIKKLKGDPRPKKDPEEDKK